MNRAVAVGAAVAGIFVLPVAAVLGVFALTGVGGGVVLAACVPPATSTGALEMVHANLYTGMTAAEFASDLQTVLSGRPDVVTLNEAYRRSAAELSPPGYAHFRGDQSREARETPVLWRTDTWEKVDASTVLMHRRPVRWGTRYVNWVTLQAPATGAVVSVISGHASPAGPGRAGLLAEFVARLDALIQELRSKGPVLVGADLNTHYPRSGFLRAWLSGSGARSTFDLLGKPEGGWATGDRGGTIDYILVAGEATAIAHRTGLLISDHGLLAATVDLGGRAPDNGGADDFSLGPVEPELRALVEVLAPLFRISRVGGFREDAVDPAGHPAGLAADFMVGSRRQGEALATYAQAHAVALGIDYIIWWQRIWSVGRADEVWRPMADRGSPTENHRDHVHINVVNDPATVPISHPSCVPTLDGERGWQPPVTDASVTSPYGWRIHPITQRRSYHSGADYGAGCGSPFVAAAAGTGSATPAPTRYTGI